jgi:hypothetical protein
MTTTWEQTPGALLRQGHDRGRALATVPGRDARPRAEQYPDAAAEHRAAWGDSRWAFAGTDEDGRPATQYVDNAGVREQMRALAADGPPVGWLDFPHLGLPPAELRPLYAAAIAAGSRVGTEGPAGRDAEYEAMIREADYARTPWAGGR